MGCDGISTNILMQISPIIEKTLTVIINQCFTKGIFPDNLKVAKNPIVQKKRVNSVNIAQGRQAYCIINYYYFVSNKLFYENQYVFCKHSKALDTFTLFS